MSTERLFVGQSFIPQLRGVNLVPPAGPKIVSWQEGTDAEIAAMLDAHYAGDIDIHDYWKIGDERIIHLSAIENSNIEGATETHVAQDMPFRLVHAGGKKLSNGKDCAFIVQQSCVLSNGNTVEGGYFNGGLSNSCGWKNNTRRTWCNTVYRNALTNTIRDIFKLHLNRTSKGNKSTELEDTEDYFAFPCEYNIFGVNQNSVVGEDNVKWSYYKNDDTRKLRDLGGFTGQNWRLRSPSKTSNYYFLCVTSWGSCDTVYGNQDCGLAPFGTI